MSIYRRFIDMGSEYEKFRYPGEEYRGFLFLKSAPAYDSSALQREKTILFDLKDCPEIVKCFGDGFCVGSNSYNLLLEYAGGGTLEDVMKDSGDRVQEWDASKYTCMLLRGLCHVHAKGYVHCALDPDHILAFLSRKKDGSYENYLKIGGFGSAKIASSDNLDYRLQELETLLGVARDDVAVDIWSLGCVVAEMLVGRDLWCKKLGKDVKDLMKNKDAEEKWFKKLPRFLSEDAKDFLKRCLTVNKNERWTSKRLLQHPFITEYDDVHLD